MKKLLTLLACCSLSAPSFGVDWVKDRTYTSSSYGMLGINYDLGYHCTDSIKISFGPAVKLVMSEGILDAGLMAKLHYHYKFENTDITPYVTFGVGGVAKIPLSENQGPDVEEFFSYQIGSGINLPLSKVIATKEPKELVYIDESGIDNTEPMGIARKDSGFLCPKIWEENSTN